MSQYRSTKDIYPFTTQPKKNKKSKESPQKTRETILCDLETHYQDLDAPAREYALVRDLVNDWNDRRLLAFWKCFEHHSRRTSQVVGAMGLDFGEARTAMVIRRALRKLQKHPQKDRFLVVARTLHQFGNGDAVLGLDDPQYVLNCRHVSDDAL